MRSVEAPGAIALKRGEGLYVASTPPPSQVPPVKATLDQILEAYDHRAKPEHAVYTTAANDVGSKRPTQATYNIDRVSIPQAFSNSFNSILYRDQGLNTGLSRSVVHSNLDPQFL
jgi:hypothetical protein